MINNKKKFVTTVFNAKQRNGFEQVINNFKELIFCMLLYISIYVWMFLFTQKKNYTLSAKEHSKYLYLVIYTVSAASAEIAHCLNFELFSGKNCDTREKFP